MKLLITFFLITISHFAGAYSYTANDRELTLQLLGSGGPDITDKRAASSYLIWIDDKSKILIDVGNSVPLRFAQAGGSIRDLDFIGISHLHSDHIVGLIPLLKSGYFSTRKEPLTIAGPSGNKFFPSIIEFLDLNFNPQTGAYRYLSSYQQGNEDTFKLMPITIDITNEWFDKNDNSKDNSMNKILASQTKYPNWSNKFINANNKITHVYTNDEVNITALSVHHGIVPTLAFRVDIFPDNPSASKSIVFASDEDGLSDELIELSKDVDLLVIHMAVGEGDSYAAYDLHTKPTVIGDIAQKSNAKALLLSHLMARSLYDLDNNIEAIREKYQGPIYLARDLMSIELKN